MDNLKKILVWDLPTRLFHWLVAVGFLVAAFLALVIGDDSSLFPYHAIIGLILAQMVVLRVIWGFLGSRYARFSSFAFGPKAVAQYMTGVMRTEGPRHVGHNPGSAWAIFAMLGLLLGIAATGLVLGGGNDDIKEIHEILAYAMVGFVVLHILGVLLHTVLHRENITASMIHGRKNADPQAGIAGPHLVAALAFCILTTAWALGLTANYNAAAQTTTLPIIGQTIQLGEAEDEGPRSSHDDEDDDDEDDDD